MPLSYVLNFDQLFKQRILSDGLLAPANSSYYDRLVKAHDEFLDRKAQLEKAEPRDYLALDHLSLLCHILQAQIESEQQLSE